MYGSNSKTLSADGARRTVKWVFGFALSLSTTVALASDGVTRPSLGCFMDIGSRLLQMHNDPRISKDASFIKCARLWAEGDDSLYCWWFHSGKPYDVIAEQPTYYCDIDRDHNGVPRFRLIMKAYVQAFDRAIAEYPELLTDSYQTLQQKIERIRTFRRTHHKIGMETNSWKDF